MLLRLTLNSFVGPFVQSVVAPSNWGKSAERCIHVLLELIENGFNPVVQESIIVIKDIFRKYPNRYESIIGKLCQNLDTLDEPEAKAAMIWIIGEYAKKIENSNTLLRGFLDNFLDEPPQVQMQLLTATVKLFLQRPKNSKSLLLRVFDMVTKECDDPDLRDRSFVYWRLLTGGPKAAEGVVLTEKPQIMDDTHRFDPVILDNLIAELSNVASVYQKPAETFVKSRRPGAHLRKAKVRSADDSVDDIPVEKLSLEQGEPQAPAPSLDLLGLDSAPEPAPAPQVNQQVNQQEEKTDPKVVLSPENSEGLGVALAYVRSGDQSLSLELTIANRSQSPMHSFALQLNTNIVGLKLAAPLSLEGVAPGQSSTTRVPLQMEVPAPSTTPSPFLQIALKNNVKIHYFQDLLPFRFIFATDGELEKGQFLSVWKELPDECESSQSIEKVRTKDTQGIQQFLKQNNVFLIALRQLPDKNVMYMSAKIRGAPILVEITLPNDSAGCMIVTKTRTAPAAVITKNILAALLSAPN